LINAAFLESLIGYNARRAALVAIEHFLEELAQFGLRPVEFSVLSLVFHNDGLTSRQLCRALGLHPPNLVVIINQFEQRQLITRRPHPADKRAVGLHLTAKAKKLIKAAEQAAAHSEAQVASRLTQSEQQRLIQLLQKIYKEPPNKELPA
jgi:DNA-binding MarR family transcriptional regulator